jgi:hypothetical protein
MDPIPDLAPDGLVDREKRLGDSRIELNPGEAANLVARLFDR